MGLLGNGFRQNLTGRISVATTALDGCMASAIPASYNLTAFRRNMLIGEGIANPQASVPQGVRPPIAWLMAKEGGGISSYKRGVVSLDGTATGEKGLPATASTTISIDGTAAGGLIVSATGTATISIDGVAAIVATISTTGTATVTIDGSVAMGAEASLVANATISIDGSAEIMGLGYMTGTTEEAGLTPSGIALAVWRALAASNDEDGTMGHLLNLAGTGGVDYDSLAQAILAAAQITPIQSTSQDRVIEGTLTEAEAQRIMLAALAGKVTKSGTNIKFKSVDGLTDRIDGAVDTEGNRTAVTLDGS